MTTAVATTNAAVDPVATCGASDVNWGKVALVGIAGVGVLGLGAAIGYHYGHLDGYEEGLNSTNSTARETAKAMGII